MHEKDRQITLSSSTSFFSCDSFCTMCLLCESNRDSISRFTSSTLHSISALPYAVIGRWREGYGHSRWDTPCCGSYIPTDEPPNPASLPALDNLTGQEHRNGLVRVASSRMRRSGAPSQLFGNAVKKPRFMPPGVSTSCLLPESKPLSPKLGLGNALEKVQKSLAAPAQSKTEYDVQFKAAQPAPALSRALARVLSAAESKENEAEREHANTGLAENTEDNRPAASQQHRIDAFT
ncbi:hypothetical protein FQN60_016968 [Etheostoma spectabile]|uniref:Uncharacterized protein n=1 Tax=Etheostoma spectabile TaxID=54343 RepID=A0A5J5DE60_9PERO|nr:hypothetical protein FQN60_016968 [Etheostoma spectabile]